MATFPVTTCNPPLGLQPDIETVRVINRTGSATVVGEVVMFDLASDTTEVTTIGGGETGVLSNVITPTTAGLRVGVFAICLEAVADNAEMDVVLRGKVKALVEGGDAAAVYDMLTPRNGQPELFSDAVTGGEKIVGTPLEASAAGTAELITILFDGFYGIGATD